MATINEFEEGLISTIVRNIEKYCNRKKYSKAGLKQELKCIVKDVYIAKMKEEMDIVDHASAVTEHVKKMLVDLNQNKQEVMVIDLDDDNLADGDKKDNSSVESNNNHRNVTHQRKISAKILHRAVKDLYQEKNYNKAIDLCSQAIELDPTNFKYYYNRSLCYLMVSKFSEGLNDVKYAIELNPKRFEAYQLLLECAIALGNTVDALDIIRKLGTEFADNSIKEQYKKDLDSQISDVRKLINLEEESRKVYENEEYHKLFDIMNQIIEISPHNVDYQIRKAESLIYLKKFDEAQGILNDVFNKNPNHPGALFAKGLLLYYQYHIDKGIHYMQRSLKLVPDNLSAQKKFKNAKELQHKRNEISEHYKAQRYEDAHKICCKALEIDPRHNIINARLHFYKGAIYTQWKNVKQTVEECSRAIELDENYVKAFLGRAQCYLQLEDFELAIYDYKKVLELEPSEENKYSLSKVISKWNEQKNRQKASEKTHKQDQDIDEHKVCKKQRLQSDLR